jgi:thiamine-phosphate pyrophosphorylase
MELKRRLRLMAIAAADVPVERIRDWARGRVTSVQLRDKICSDDEFVSRGRLLAQACKDEKLLFIINDRAHLIHEFPGAGVHLGQSDLGGVQDLPTGTILGISVASVAEAKAAQALGADYLGVGPVFATPSKLDAVPAIGLAGIAAVRAACSLPLVAIGGIDADTAAAVLQAGADAIAVIRFLNQGDAAAAARVLAAAIGRAA